MYTLIKNSFKSKMKVRKWILFQALFPIFLMVLVGTLVSGYFSSEFKIEKTTIYYYNNGNNESKNTFNITKDNIDKESFIFEEVKSKDMGPKIAEEKNKIYVEIEDNKVKIYSTNENSLAATIVYSTFSAIDKSKSNVEAFFKIDPKKASEVIKNYNERLDVKEEILDKEKVPTSYDYYGVAELTLMIMYIMAFSLGELHAEKVTNIRERIVVTLNSPFKYYLSRLIGSFLVGVVLLIPGFLFSVFVLKANWGDNILLAFIYLSVFALLTSSIGTLVGVLANDIEKSMGIIDGITPVFAFLGGAFMALEDNMGGIFQIVTYLSPLRWLNRGLFRMIYQSDYGIINTTSFISILIVLGAVFIIFLASKREEKRRWKI